ncbi:MAG: glycerol kinase, partial [Acidobacteria bacterium]|nr:glycerol kinase [Acidobacteriota bacterium]
MSYILALDQGTTSSRTILFERRGTAAASAQEEFPQLYPSPGHVEHDPEAIWSTQLATAHAAIRKAGAEASDLEAIGIANQRETVVLWERDSGKPVDNAIVWQSRITAPLCEQLKEKDHEDLFRARTGLVLDPYFSGTKIAHLLDEHDLHARAARGEILAGTIDSFLLWRLTDGEVHATDASNASRTLLFDIHKLDWDDELLEILRVPRAMLPEVRDSSGDFGHTEESLFGRRIPIAGIAGDQQAATFGQACFEPGACKNTYGTGCFILMNTGGRAVASDNGLLSTVGWVLDGKPTYCLEGSVFVGGAAVQWLRDGLGLIESS